MKNKFLIIAIITVIGFTMIACEKSEASTPVSENVKSNDSGVKIITSADELKAYLDKQPANTPDKPIKVNVSINDLMIKNIADVIKSAGKYVNLNITGNALTNIPKNTFSGCETLVGIKIPNSVTNIDDLAFSNCDNLTSVKIPDGVTDIGFGVFEKCAELTDVTIGNGISRIENSAFFGCKNLTNITIGSGVTIIGRSAFTGCKNLTSVTFERSGTNLGTSNEFIDNENTSFLRTAYTNGGIGTYTRPNTKGITWTKQ